MVVELPDSERAMALVAIGAIAAARPAGPPGWA